MPSNSNALSETERLFSQITESLETYEIFPIEILIIKELQIVNFFS